MSPIAGRDPLSGDTTYTETLLASPPPGVSYTSYADALKAGTLRLRGRRPRHGRMSPADALILVARLLEKALRGRLLFREPIWPVTISDDFDLVHQHLFAVRQIGSSVPSVSSAGFPLRELYAAREGWPTPRLRLAEGAEWLIARMTGGHTPGVRCRRGDALSTYTKHFQRYVEARHPGGTVTVCGQGMPDLWGASTGSTRLTVGFIGRDFHRKGGDIAVAAFRVMQQARPDLRLLIVTASDSSAELTADPAIHWVAGAAQTDVVERHLPAMDVLLAPTRADCGVPFGLLEALRAGVPIVTSENPWLDDRLAGGGVRRVALDPQAVSSAAGELLDDLPASKLAARRLYEDCFTMERLHVQLLELYGSVLSGSVLT